MKRFFLTALCLVAFICLLIPKAEASSGTYCGLTWEYNEATTTITITGQGAMSEVETPPWSNLHSKCTTVVVGEGVTALAGEAFKDFEKLTSVSLPSTLTKIYGSAFSNCDSLTQIRIPDGVTYIGSYCFAGSGGLTEINIPSGVTELNVFTFPGCYSLAKVTLPSTLKTINMSAFDSCLSLQEVTLPDSVTYLGDSAFSGCYSLAKVTMSKNLEHMGSNVFMDCISLSSIVIPDKVSKLDHYTFYCCYSLTDVTIGAGVNTIDPNIFHGCYSLENITVSSKSPYFTAKDGVIYTADKKKLILANPNTSGSYTVLSGTETIGAKSFNACVFLTDVVLPESVTDIENDAFNECISLKTVKLGSGLLYVRTGAFANTALTSVTIPESVKLLDEIAFGGCYELKEVRFLGRKPTTIKSNTFAYVTATVYYKPGESWKNMGSYGGTLTWEEINCNGNHTPATQPGKAATCTAEGLSDGSYCSVCGEVLKTQTAIGAKGHSYGEWTVVTPATTEAEGKSQRTCSACGRTEEKTVSNLTQTLEPTVEATQPSATTPQEAPTLPNQPTQTAPAQPTQTPQKPEKKSSPVIWVVIGAVALVLAADAVVGVIFLRKRKK